MSDEDYLELVQTTSMKCLIMLKQWARFLTQRSNSAGIVIVYDWWPKLEKNVSLVLFEDYDIVDECYYQPIYIGQLFLLAWVVLGSLTECWDAMWMKNTTAARK